MGRLRRPVGAREREEHVLEAAFLAGELEHGQPGLVGPAARGREQAVAVLDRLEEHGALMSLDDRHRAGLLQAPDRAGRLAAAAAGHVQPHARPDPGLRAQLVGRSAADDPPAAHHQQPVGERRGLLQDVRRQHHRALRGELLDESPDLEDLVGIEARRRLVEDHDLRIVDERLGERRALAVALRERDDGRAEHAVEAALADDPLDAPPELLAAEAARAADEAQTLADLHREVERQRLRQVADAPAHLEGFRHHVEPGHPRRSRGRDLIGGQDAHRGRLAGAVRA